jgi:hypothetical protein
MPTVTHVTDEKRIVELAEFARKRFAPFLDTWYCGGGSPPFMLEKHLVEAVADKNRVFLVARDDPAVKGGVGDIVGYTIVRVDDQFCESFIPDPVRADLVFDLLVEECCQRFPNMWGTSMSPEYRRFLTAKVSRRVVLEDGPAPTYRIVDP